jgi:translocation and assembly module TamA
MDVFGIARLRGGRMARAAAGTALGLWVGLAPGWSQTVPVQLAVQGEEDLASEIEGASLLLRAEDEGLVEAQDLIAAARADYTRILGRLYSEGYYGPVVSILIDGQEAAELPPFADVERIGRIDIRVETGPLYRFGRAEVAPVAPRTELPEEFARGEEAPTGVIRRTATAAVEGWREAGRAKAEAEDPTIVADFARTALDVTIAIRPGPVVRFGELTVEGNRRVRTERIREIAGFPRSGVFDPGEIERVQERLRRTGAFRAVALTEDETLGPGDTLDFDLTVIEALPRRFGFGAEFGTSEGGSVEAFWMHRNLFGGAERLRFEGEVDGIGASGEENPDYRLTARFERPATFDPDTDFTALAEIERLDEPAFTSDIARLEAGVIRYATEDLTLRGGVQLRFSQVEDDLGERELRHLVIPLQATQDKRDDRLNPSSGYFADVMADPFVGIGDSETGARLYADGRYYYGIGESDRVVLAGRLQLGSVVGSAIEGTPPDFLFFSGGGGTVRGQPFESLAVERGDGEFGGRSFVGLQSEARVGITDSIGAVAFADFGMIGEDAFGGSTESHAGAGLGMRYQTGIGPIRFDLAAPVSGDTEDGIQFYLGIGQAF